MKAFNTHVHLESAEALSVVTNREGLWNVDDIVIACVGPVHTVGDLFINFRNTNIIHSVDLYF